MRRVTLLPRVIVETQGRVLSELEMRALTEVRVQQRLSLPTLCELTLRDPPGPLEIANTLLPGASLRVEMQGERTPLFVGQVTAIEYSYTANNERLIYVRAYDLLHRLRKRQSVRVHSNVTIQKLARDLVNDLGLTVEATEAGLRWWGLFQHQQSDFELLGEAAAQAGLYFFLRENALCLFTLAGYGAPQALALGDNLLDAHIEVNTDAVCDTVVVTSWNPLNSETYVGRATRGRSGRQLGAAPIAASQVGGSGRYDLVNVGTPDKTQAEALAQAELDYRTALAVTLTGAVQGNPALQPGVPIRVTGVAEPLIGTYVLTEVTHVLDREGGFISEINTAPPALRPRSRSSVATLGIVTQVDDGDALGRVKAKLPTYNNVETDWMGVLTPGAGKNKGFIALPDVGDTVLVLLTNENPGQGVVLGGLYGAQKPPDSGVTLWALDAGLSHGSVTRHTWVTPGGQRIQLDDRGNVIRLQNEAGSYIELAGGNITIAGAAIDFRRI